MFFYLSLFVCLSVAFSEPICTQFSYQEQLLEKVIDIKYHMDIFSSKMDKWEKLISEKIDSVNEIKGELDQKVKDVQIFFNETMDFITEKVNDETKKLETKILLDGMKTPDVYFKARSVKDRSPSKGDTIVFKTIVQNEGSGYNNDTGIFIAPVSGTYLFTTQFCLENKKELGVTMVANGVIITAATFGDKDWAFVSKMFHCMCTSTDGIARVQQGHSVKVKTAFASSGIVIYADSSRYWSYFSGILIRK